MENDFTIIGTILQTSPHELYSPECHNCNGNGCDCWRCSAWTYWDDCAQGTDHWSDDSCCFTCRSKTNCSRVNPALCKFGNIQGDAKFSPNNNINKHEVVCTFNKSEFDKMTADDREKFLTTYTLSDGDNDKLTEQVCSRMHSGGCASDLATCSGYKSVDSKWDFCGKWLEKQKSNVAKYNSVINSYCKKNPMSSDCACVNRANNPSAVYNTVQLYNKSTNPINDGCWYKPCIGEPNLIPHELINPECPSTICQTVIDAINARDVNISNVSSEIKCTSELKKMNEEARKQNIAELEKHPEYNIDYNNHIVPIPSIQSFFSSHKVVIMGISIICVILFFYFILRKNK